MKKGPLHLKWIHFVLRINYYKSEGVFSATLFTILNDGALWPFLDLKNKILTVKWNLHFN